MLVEVPGHPYPLLTVLAASLSLLESNLAIFIRDFDSSHPGIQQNETVKAGNKADTRPLVMGCCAAADGRGRLSQQRKPVRQRARHIRYKRMLQTLRGERAGSNTSTA